MKKLFLLLVCLVITGGLIISCGDETTSNNAVPLEGFNETATIQGTILNAITGERIGGVDLNVKLIQGTNHRDPSKLIRDVNNSLVGEYAFASVPIALYDNIKYMIVVTNTGYQRFEGEFEMTADAGVGGVVDENYNKIWNIYLFPEGAEADDVVIYVESGATWDATTGDNRVPDATVQLVQDIENNNVIGGESGNRLFPTTGLLPVLTATTDADGVATFSGADLVLGGQYLPTVLPLTYSNTQMALTAGTAIVVGTNVDPQTITLTDVVEETLQVVSASNKDPNGITATGVLTLIFNRPVTIVEDATVDAAILCDGGACPNAVLDADSATAVLSNGGYTLTLTPNFTADPDVSLGDESGVIAYSNVEVTLDNVNAIDVFSLDCTDGVAISNEVNVTGLQ